MIPIVDAHLDLAWNALSWSRDLTLPLAELNAGEAHMTDHRGRGRATVSLPEMRKGNVALCLGTLLARAKPSVRPAEGFNRRSLDFPTQAHACAIAQGQLAYYRLLEEQKQIRIVTRRDDLPEKLTGSENLLIVAMEGADPITSPAQLPLWHTLGLRVIGLAHYGPSAYGVGTGDSGPLTSAGVELLKEISQLQMILDLTHSSDPSFFEALDRFDGAVLASHNNCRALVPGDRQFSDEQIRLLIQRNAVIGVAFDAWMLHAGWKIGSTDRRVIDLNAVVNQIDHICQLAGNTQHVGIGSDLDGGFGNEQTPSGLDSIADLQKLAPILHSRGYSDGDIANIFHGNWMRFFRAHLPA